MNHLGSDPVESVDRFLFSKGNILYLLIDKNYKHLVMTPLDPMKSPTDAPVYLLGCYIYLSTNLNGVNLLFFNNR